MGTNIVGYALVIGPKIKYPLVGALVLLPYLDRSRQGVGRWFARERVLANAVFTVCLVVAIVLTIIGTSFRGPELDRVGARRSPEWLNKHFLAPASVSPGSAMSPCAGIIKDAEVDDLVAYLRSLKPKGDDPGF